MTEKAQQEEIAELPELSVMTGLLQKKLGWENCLSLQVAEEVDLSSLKVADASGAKSTSEAILISGYNEESQKDLDARIESMVEALDAGGLGVFCAKESELSRSQTDLSADGYNYQQLTEKFAKKGVKVIWGCLTQSNDLNFERHSSMLLLSKEEAVIERVAELMKTGLCNFALSPGLPEVVQEPSRPARICICTDEIFGPSSNGGIGTAYTSMANFLAEAGQEVTVLFNGDVTSREPISFWVSYYAERNITLVPADLPQIEGLPWQDEYMRRSWADYQWLKEENEERQFDVIHFPECNGKAFYSILAKKQGIAFANTAFCLGTHGNTRWVYEGHGMEFFSTYQLATDYMEQFAIENTDVLVSPSYFLINWMENEGWQMPHKWFVQQNFQPATARGEDLCRDEPYPTLEEIGEFIFFGRLESRKGIVQFCDALDILKDELEEKDIKITFMGKVVPILETTSEAYLKERSKGWGFEWQMINDFNQDKAVAYLQGEGRVAIIPSLADNSPYTVLECIGLGIPFMSTRIGGISELMDPRDVAQTTFHARRREDLGVEIAASIQKALKDGLRPTRRSVSAPDNDKVWVDWHKSLVESPAWEALPSPAKEPTVAVVRPIAALSTLSQVKEVFASYRNQNTEAEELALLVEAEQSQDIDNFWAREAVSLEKEGISKVPNSGLGAVEGLINYVEQSSADYLLISMTDSTAQPYEIESLKRIAAQSQADIYTPMMSADGTNVDIPTERIDFPMTFFPIGPVPLLPLLAHAYGYDHLFIRKEALLSALRAMAKDNLQEVDISTIIALAVQNDFVYEIIPEPLFTYHHHEEEVPATVITVGDTEPSPTMGKAFSKSLPRELSGLLTFRKSGGPTRNDQAHAQMWELRYQMEEELPELKEELQNQTDWLAEREKTIEALMAEHEKTKEVSVLHDKLKQEMREMKLKNKVLEKEIAHLTYRLRRKISVRIGDSISKRAGKKESNLT